MRWISTDEQKPVAGDTLLLLGDTKYVGYRLYKNYKFVYKVVAIHNLYQPTTLEEHEITHWMPYPKLDP